jgi:hypothetical protein
MTAWDMDAVRELRVAVAAGDAEAIGAAVADRELDDVLQLVGDGLLTSPPDPLARRCAERLRARGLEGDAELADALEGRSGELRPLPVDVEELSSILEGDPLQGGGRLDLTTGDVWHESPYGERIEDEDDLDDPDRWLWAEASSDDGWWDMSEFAETVADDAFAERLQQAIQGRGAFHRFRDVLDEHPDELTRFHVFSEERQRGRARHWLAQHGLRSVGRRYG